MATQPLTIDSQTTANQQREALLNKQQGFLQQLDTNTTKAANVGRLNRATGIEQQKKRAQSEAAAAGRPWTTADDKEWADRANQANTQAETAMLLGREQTQREAMSDIGGTVSAGEAGQFKQKELGQEDVRILNADKNASADRELRAKLSQAELDAQRNYREQQLKAEAQRLALQQSQQLQTQMYGPGGAYGGYPAGTPAYGAGGSAASAPGGVVLQRGSLLGSAAPRPLSTGSWSGGGSGVRGGGFL